MPIFKMLLGDTKEDLRDPNLGYGHSLITTGMDSDDEFTTGRVSIANNTQVIK
jgi:hypothetical protein